MWQPTGPLPSAVYWRRRALAAVFAAVIVLGAMVAVSPDEWAMTTRAALPHSQPTEGTADGLDADGDGSGGLTAAAGTSHAAGLPSAVGGTSGAPASGGAAPAGTAALAAGGTSLTEGGLASVGAMVAPRALVNGGSPAIGPTAGSEGVAAPTGGAPGAPQGNGAAIPAASVTSEQLRPDESPRPAPVAAPVPVPPTGPVPCTNAMIGVTSEIDAPVHVVGQRPVLRLVITNTSAQPCVRDLDSSRQEIAIWSGDGKTRLWSSNDCGNAGSPDLRTLVPGQPVVFAVTWAGRTSTPGCAQARTVVPAGDYRMVSRLDDDVSQPTSFRLTP